MTALAAVPPADVRPVPWTRLAWVAWRRHRSTLLAALTVLALVAIYLIITGLQIRSAWHNVQACTPADSGACNFAWTDFKDAHTNPGIISALFLFAPLLIGAFTGAPLIGRELETGTFRYAWTQGVGRTRWLIAMTVSGAVVVAVLSGGLGALISWHDQPLWAADVTPKLQASEFPSIGVAVIGWALVAYAVGLLAGLLFRRVLPALGTAVVATFALAFAASRVRLHYLPAHRTSSLAYVPGSQTLAQWWEKAGAHVSTAYLDTILRAAGMQQFDTGGGSVSASPGSGDDPVSYLLHHGYTQWTSYQPANRYWAFQWIEFGWLVAITVVLVAITFLLIGKRDA
jgi:hypothetical protein